MEEKKIFILTTPIGTMIKIDLTAMVHLIPSQQKIQHLLKLRINLEAEFTIIS